MFSSSSSSFVPDAPAADAPAKLNGLDEGGRVVDAVLGDTALDDKPPKENPLEVVAVDEEPVGGNTGAAPNENAGIVLGSSDVLDELPPKENPPKREPGLASSESFFSLDGVSLTASAFFVDEPNENDDAVGVVAVESFLLEPNENEGAAVAGEAEAFSDDPKENDDVLDAENAGVDASLGLAALEGVADPKDPFAGDLGVVTLDDSGALDMGVKENGASVAFLFCCSRGTGRVDACLAPIASAYARYSCRRDNQC
jgi:hypothetical protein